MKTNFDKFSDKVMRCFAYRRSIEIARMLKPKEFKILEINIWLIYFFTNIPILMGKWIDKENSQELINASNIEAIEILENKDFCKDFYSNVKLRSEDKILTHSEFMRISIDIIRSPEISEKFLIPKEPMLYACLITEIEEIGINDLV